MYAIQKLSLLIFLLISSLLSADPLFPKTDQSAFVEKKISFLPVEQAYHLNVLRQDGVIRLSWKMADGYYLYKHQFAFFSSGQKQLHITPVFEQKGIDVYDEYFKETLEVFYRQLDMTIDLSFLAAGGEFFVQSQACADAGLCYPPRRQRVSFSSDSGEITVSDFLAMPEATLPVKQPQAKSLWVILSFALLGGLILNLMPCVFPVLSIKVLSLATHHQSARKKLAHGGVYSFGVIASFVAVAAVMLLLRSAGQAVGWGFQLQSPFVVAMLVYLFVLMGLSFSGFFSMGSRWMNFGQGSVQGVSLQSSFLAGVLATVVASPCSAPFMGTALGFALTQTVTVSLLVFATLGVGMAAPVFALAAWPRLAARMPRPGGWMESLKQLLAFPLYLSAVWLLWVLGHQAGSDTVAAMLAGLVLLALALWLVQAKRYRKGAVFFAVLCVVGAMWLPLKTYQHSLAQKENSWEVFSETKLETLLTSGVPVFVNVTADWCITCLANEKVVLGSDDIKAAFEKKGVVYLKADWTTHDAEITGFLNKHQRSGVPLYLFYPRGQRIPVILPQILTKRGVLSEFSGR